MPEIKDSSESDNEDIDEAFKKHGTSARRIVTDRKQRREPRRVCAEEECNENVAMVQGEESKNIGVESFVKSLEGS